MATAASYAPVSIDEEDRRAEADTEADAGFPSSVPLSSPSASSSSIERPTLRQLWSGPLRLYISLAVVAFALLLLLSIVGTACLSSSLFPYLSRITSQCPNSPPFQTFPEDVLSRLSSYSTVDPTVVHPSATPAHLHWRVPDSPTPEQFAALHPAYPPARFLASFAQGGWTPRYERYEGHPTPRLRATSPWTSAIRRDRQLFEQSADGHLRKYCQVEEDVTYRQPRVVQVGESRQCARMWWYSSSQACHILSHFTAVHLSGDSLMRQVHHAMLQLLSDDFDDGHVDAEAAADPHSGDCFGDLGYEGKACRGKIAYHTRLAGRRICPTLNIDPLPNPSPPTFVPFDPATPSATPSDVPWISNVLNLEYHAVFVRGHLSDKQYDYPAILTAEQRRAVQEEWMAKRTKAQSPESGVRDRADFVYALPTQIGALHVDELGLHGHELGGDWPLLQLIHYDDAERLLLYESHVHSPPLPIYPLYLGLHAMVQPLFNGDYYNSINHSHTAQVVPSIARHLHSRHSPFQWWAGTTGQTEPQDEAAVDLSLLHHDEPELTGYANMLSADRWNLEQELATCRYSQSPPGASTVDASRYNASRECCSHAVRPWQLLDTVRLTSHIPFAWSYDGTHYKQWVNTWKAQAILNYAHTLIQMHQKTSGQTTSW